MGRKSVSGMSSNRVGGGGSVSVRQAFGNKSLDQVAQNYVDDLKFRAGSHASADEKYDQMEDLANGRRLDYHAVDAVRTQAFDSAPDEYVSKDSRGRATGWKMTYDQNGNMRNGNSRLLEDLGESNRSALNRSLQRAAKQWLKDHPKPSASERKNYRWDGTKYVKK